MKDIRLKNDNVEFGNTARDVLLKIDLENEKLARKTADNELWDEIRDIEGASLVKTELIDDGGDLNINLDSGKVVVLRSTAIDSLNLNIPDVLTPFYFCEISFRGDQSNHDWQFNINIPQVLVTPPAEDDPDTPEDEYIAPVLDPEMPLKYVQFNRLLENYDPKQCSSVNAVIDLLFYFDGINLYCYINEIAFRIGVS